MTLIIIPPPRSNRGANRDGFSLLLCRERPLIFTIPCATFVIGPRMSHERIDHAATPILSGPNAGKILFAGGIEHSSTATEFYAPRDNSFGAGPPMNSARDGQTASVIPSGATAEKILLVGGWGEHMIKEDVAAPVPLASTELYGMAGNS